MIAFYDAFLPSVDEGEFELELGGVDGEDSGSEFPVETEDVVALDAGEVHGQVQGTDDSMIAVDQCVLDVVAGGVHKHSTLVPDSRLDADATKTERR